MTRYCVPSDGILNIKSRPVERRRRWRTDVAQAAYVIGWRQEGKALFELRVPKPGRQRRNPPSLRKSSELNAIASPKPLSAHLPSTPSPLPLSTTCTTSRLVSTLPQPARHDGLLQRIVSPQRGPCARSRAIAGTTKADSGATTVG